MGDLPSRMRRAAPQRLIDGHRPFHSEQPEPASGLGKPPSRSMSFIHPADGRQTVRELAKRIAPVAAAVADMGSQP